MIFRQLFESVSGSYTYLIAARRGGGALIIDPVLERVDRYIQLLDELGLRLVKVFDTHVHADHVTGMGALRDRTKCITIMGEQSPVDVVSVRVGDGDTVDIEGLSLDVMYTPGHTIDSYCLRMTDRVFTGDTLLIRGTGRTDFQGGSSHDAYESLFNKLLKLPDETLVYPGHDYKGDTVSTIGEERAHNPRLRVASAEEYAVIMDNLNLPNPKMMDVAVPANVAIGRGQGVAGQAAWALTADQVMDQCNAADVALVDLRDASEREADGVIPGSIHAPYTGLEPLIRPGGMLREMVGTTGRRLIFYCAFGERSAMAVESSQEHGLDNVCHLIGGIDAWRQAGGPIEAPGTDADRAPS